MAGQDGGHRDPASLAEAEVVRRSVGGTLHAHGGERFMDPGVELVAADAEVPRTERDVVAYGRHEELVVRILEHDADATPDLGEVALVDGETADADGRRRR